MKRLLAVFASAGFLAMLVALVPATASAASAMTGSSVSFAKSETHNGTLYAAGQTIAIDGAVNGDLVCAGQSVTINGSVSGDVICAAQNLIINGAIAGNVRVMGQTVTLNGTIGKNLNVATQTLTFGPNATVSGEAGIWAGTAVVSVPVGSNLYGSMSTLTLESTVGGNVDVIVESLNMGSSAKVTGNLGYASSATFNINQAQVGGTIKRSDAPAKSSNAKEAPKPTFAGWVAGELYIIAALLAIALPLAWFGRRPVRRLSQTMLDRPGQSIGWGFVTQLILPIALIMLFITIIGIPLALLTILLWVILFALTTIFAGIAFGRLILKRAKWHEDSLIWATIVGVILVTLVTSIPFLGFLLMIVAVWWVTGGLLLSLKYLR